MTYDRRLLKRAGDLRRKARAMERQARDIVLAELGPARSAEPKLTWREIAEDTTYTETQLRSMMLPAEEQERREQKRRERRRKTPGPG